MGELWLTSAEHWFWHVPRRLDLRRLLRGPEPGSTYADLDVAPDQPDSRPTAWCEVGREPQRGLADRVQMTSPADVRDSQPEQPRELWLTSGEHWFWDVPRRLTTRRVIPGPEAGSTYADLDVAPDQPDAPMHLLARPRYARRWVDPTPGHPVRVLVWQLPTQETSLDADGVILLPTRLPTAWCTVTASRDEASRAGR